MQEEFTQRQWRAVATAATVAAVAFSLLAASVAEGAGDPIAKGSVALQITKGFKKALKRNRIGMKPKNFAIRPNASRFDPVAGTGKILLKGKLRFRGHGKRLTAGRLILRIGGKLGKRGANIRGKLQGRDVLLMRLRAKPQGSILERNGFGARLSKVAARLSKPLAKAVNRRFDLNSLVASRRVAKLTINEQPRTVEVLGGTVLVDIPTGYLPPSILPGTGADPNTVAAKQPAHCISPLAGVHPLEPGEVATLTSPNPDVGPLPTGVAARFKFPVTGGTIGPAGNDGVIQVAGGVRLESGAPGGPPPTDGIFPQGSQCASTPPGPGSSASYLDTSALAPNLGERNVQSNIFIGGTAPGCTFSGGGPSGCGVFPGDKGIAIGQVLDASQITVAADPTAKTIQVNGALIRNNPTSTLTLNGLFPNGSGNPAMDFADGDKFGISSLSVKTR